MQFPMATVKKNALYTILSSSGSQKKIEHELTYLFSFPAVTIFEF
jgi:hypothetical protein